MHIPDGFLSTTTRGSAWTMQADELGYRQGKAAERWACWREGLDYGTCRR
jgi:ABC-type Co2+ transport system permease subunit